MGRRRIENPTSSKEKMRKHCENAANRVAENERCAEVRNKKKEEMTDLQERRRRDKEPKRMSRESIKKNCSHQKLVEQKIKDRNRKAAKPPPKATSTPHVIVNE